MNYQVDSWNNFCRVFTVPMKFPEGYWGYGEAPITFQMVDWFNPVSGVGQVAISKDEWLLKFGSIDIETVSLEELQNKLVPFLKQKQYYNKELMYLVICDFGASFMFTGE